ncbi:MAG: asparagine synthase (glutamine-hydrolyzing) [Syntrophobacterales bacterium]|jgi:asparagine synthase (glutamine-hydrolysing)
MCGICGKISLKAETVSSDLISRMMRSLVHRGPDDEGSFVKSIGANSGSNITIGLGHKRLSIIDLSRDGRQPLTNEDETLWLIFNGEIYNHPTLRQELLGRGHRFRSETDTEVILHLYEEKGIDALQDLNGMFAFALWDEPRQRLYLCRDRLGIKPLIYYQDNSCLVFASEIQALLKDKSVPREMDRNALILYLTFNYIPAPFTIYQGTKKLLPGHYLLWEKGSVSTHKYWDVTTNGTSSSAGDFHQHSQTLRQTLEDAVRIRMIADVPLGAFLSGGIDSGIIVALMARNSGKKIKTFNVSYPDLPIYDESSYARDVARMYGTDHHEIRINSSEMLQIIPEALSTLGEPFADSSILPTLVISKETRKKVTVALAGDGGDELFAGYRLYLGETFFKYYEYLPKWFRRYGLESWIPLLPDSRNAKWLEYIRRVKKFIGGARGDLMHRLFLWREVFSGELITSLLNGDLKPDGKYTGESWLRGLDHWPGDNLNRLLYVEVKDSLPCDMLTKVDLMSMKKALEVRVPLLDHRVVEAAFRMPGSMKLRGLKRKYILLETFKDLLPLSLHRRPKQGFEVPISAWLQNELKDMLEDYLSPQLLKKQSIFSSEVVESLKRDHRQNRKDTSWLLWNLIVFQHWYSTQK